MTEMLKPTDEIRGFKFYKELISPFNQERIVADIREVVREVPLRSPLTPSGYKMSVMMTSAGKLGWTSDTKGYRYENKYHNGRQWPPIPSSVISIWDMVSECRRQPDSCLINLYLAGAKMGMHRDVNETDNQWPVVSISLGDDALFRIGNLNRGGKTESIWLQSGDVAVMGGEARLCYHGIDRIRFKSSQLLRNGGRLNLTLRVAG